MIGPAREVLDRLARRLRREHFNRIHHHEKDTMTPTTEPHPLARIAANMNKPVTVHGDLIEDVDGRPFAVTESVTAPVIGMVITDLEAAEAGIDPRTPGVTIVDRETGAVISRGDDMEDEQL